MIHLFLKGLTDLFYGTKRLRRTFERDNPNEKVLAANASKSIMSNTNEDIKRGIHWVTSQRAVVLLTEKKIVCGKWSIPLDTISSAQLIKVNSLFGGAQVLKIHTVDEKNYQFGMQLNAEWTDQTILPLTVEQGRVKYSVFSIILRIIVVGYLIFWLYQRLL